jgi:broad specificity phosphatase PhoE
VKTGRWEPSSKAIEARAREARVWLRGLGREHKGEEDVNVVVVTHGGFLHYFTEDVSIHTYKSIPFQFLMLLANHISKTVGRLLEILRHRVGEHRVPQLSICG